MQKQLVHVGSMSEHKLGAVREAFAELGIDALVIGAKTSSGVNEQPVRSPGNNEIIRGAKNRAGGALSFGDCDIAIGIENGIEFRKDSQIAFVVDFATIALVDEDRWFFADSAAHPVNYIDAEEARRRGFDKHTVASVTRERTGCDATDATPHYTGGRMTRKELLKQAVKLAVCQWLAAKEGAK